MCQLLWPAQPQQMQAKNITGGSQPLDAGKGGFGMFDGSGFGKGGYGAWGGGWVAAWEWVVAWVVEWVAHMAKANGEVLVLHPRSTHVRATMPSSCGCRALSSSSSCCHFFDAR